MDNGRGRDQSNANEGMTTTAQKQSKKRIITPARKEQNKLAQRAYRKRQKEHNRDHERSAVLALQRLEPRLNSIEATCISRSPASPRHSIQLEHGHSTTIRSRSPLRGPDFALNPDLEPKDLLAMGRQLPLRQLPSSIPRGGVDTTSNAYSERNGMVGAVVGGVRRSLEDSPTGILRACLSNAICMGIDMAELISCGRSCMSPFYRPMTQMNDDHAALMAISSHDSLPASLKPTPAQILIPHHASLDLIPLPRLRERAILMCAALPHVFSLWEMKLDIYTRNALVCHSRDTSSGVTFQPWDMRSWRAAPWFLSKWKMVVDTDEIGPSLSLSGIPGLWM
ncbi:hypothetical protein F5Y14DRAFT_455661 [Nemania sp. NC0429]|nr:hypothetical protein F5Y14DRAFT_455661 [Nemania sp. NC0429]